MESFLCDLVHTQRLQGLDSHALVHGDPLDEDPPWLRRVPVQAQLLYAPIALGFRGALVRAISEIRPDVLHLHLPNNSAFWALTVACARQIPWVVHWHSDVIVSDRPGALRQAYLLYRPFEQAVLERAERIIVTSPPYLRPANRCAAGATNVRQYRSASTQSHPVWQTFQCPGRQDV